MNNPGINSKKVVKKVLLKIRLDYLLEWSNIFVIA